MPDVHVSGKTLVGLTMTVHDAIMPEMIDGDIGCGVRVIKIKDDNFSFKDIDRKISGCLDNLTLHYTLQKKFTDVCCKKYYNFDKMFSCPDLGTGNHFIEIALEIPAPILSFTPEAVFSGRRYTNTIHHLQAC